MRTYNEISDWMNLNIDSYIDSMTGELCCTEMAEDCADHFGEGEIIPELYYDVAVNVEAALLGNSFDNF